jgi:predicted HTH transcriptional regulator
MTEAEFAEHLARGHEQRAVEFKGVGARGERPFFSRVVRAVLAMSNTQDGGLVVIGVSETEGVLDPIGLDGATLRTWRHDDIAAGAAEYADPFVSFETTVVPFQGKQFIALRVREFESVPVLCKKQYDIKEKQRGKPKVTTILRRGACYVRTRTKPESREIDSHVEMRELIRLAAEKNLRELLGSIERAGGTVVAKAETAAAPSERDAFQGEASDFT